MKTTLKSALLAKDIPKNPWDAMFFSKDAKVFMKKSSPGQQDKNMLGFKQEDVKLDFSPFLKFMKSIHRSGEALKQYITMK